LQEISTNVESGTYIQRLKEALGTDEPAKVQRKLGISYQAAKNYLKGRLPAPEVLQGIAKETGYSIHWLLTGEGSKKVPSDDNGSSHRNEPTGRPEQLAEDVVDRGLSRAEVLLLIQLGYKILEKLERMETRLAQLDNG
jgi:transcriptional regulator with XRE-family HTH domain